MQRTEVGRLPLPRSLRRWLQLGRGPSDVYRDAHKAHGVRGSVSLTAAERASLRVDPVVTDALIEDLLPTVEYMAFFGSMAIGDDVRRAWESEARERADAARAFRALLEEPTRLGYTYFVGRWIKRGMPRRDAERRFVHLLADLKDLEADLRLHASGVNPRNGNDAELQADHLVRGAAVSWRQHTGQQPDTSESSAFVKFCLALAALAEFPLGPDRIRLVLSRGL